MKDFMHWSLTDGEGKTHLVEYRGMSFTGQVKLAVDGIESGYVANLVRQVGSFVPFRVAGVDAVLKIDLRGRPVDLAVAGVYLGSGAPLESGHEESASAGNPQSALLLKKVKAGRTSFLTMILLTLVNLILVLVNSTLSFPFSAEVPQLAIAVGKSMYNDSHSGVALAVGAAIALFITAVYFLLYLLSERHIAASVLALVFFSIDTVLLVGFGFAAGDYGYLLIGLAFHAWVIYSMLPAITAKKKLDALARSEGADETQNNTGESR